MILSDINVYDYTTATGLVNHWSLYCYCQLSNYFTSNLTGWLWIVISVTEKSKGSAPEIVVPDLLRFQVWDFRHWCGWRCGNCFIWTSVWRAFSSQNVNNLGRTIKHCFTPTCLWHEFANTSWLPTGHFRLLLSSSTGGRSSAGLNVIHHMVYPITLTFSASPTANGIIELVTQWTCGITLAHPRNDPSRQKCNA